MHWNMFVGCVEACVVHLWFHAEKSHNRPFFPRFLLCYQVQPSSLSSATTTSNTDSSFCVVVQDQQGNLASLDEVHTLSSNISTTSDIEAGDTVFRVNLPENSLLEVPVASYTCNPQLRPIPMVRFLFLSNGFGLHVLQMGVNIVITMQRNGCSHRSTLQTNSYSTALYSLSKAASKLPTMSAALGSKYAPIRPTRNLSTTWWFWWRFHPLSKAKVSKCPAKEGSGTKWNEQSAGPCKSWIRAKSWKFKHNFNRAICKIWSMWTFNFRFWCERMFPIPLVELAFRPIMIPATMQQQLALGRRPAILSSTQWHGALEYYIGRCSLVLHYTFGAVLHFGAVAHLLFKYKRKYLRATTSISNCSLHLLHYCNLNFAWSILACQLDTHSLVSSQLAPTSVFSYSNVHN